MYLLILLISIIFIALYVNDLRKTKFNIRILLVIAIFGALGYVLNLFKFINMPQGGSITFFSMLPTMILSFIYGRGVGLTSGLLLGGLKLLDGAVILNPFQFLLDYMLSNMCLGFSNIFGRKSRVRIFMGCLLAAVMCTMFNVLSGVLFYGEFAPEGMNVWVYSLIYNFSSIGVEGVLTAIVASFFPFDRVVKNIKA